MQSSIDTFDDTTKEDQQQNCISDIVNNTNNVEEHYSIDDTNEVEQLNMEETSSEKETEEEKALDMEEDPIHCAIKKHNMFVFYVGRMFVKFSVVIRIQTPKMNTIGNPRITTQDVLSRSHVQFVTKDFSAKLILINIYEQPQ